MHSMWGLHLIMTLLLSQIIEFHLIHFSVNKQTPCGLTSYLWIHGDPCQKTYKGQQERKRCKDQISEPRMWVEQRPCLFRGGEEEGEKERTVNGVLLLFHLGIYDLFLFFTLRRWRCSVTRSDTNYVNVHLRSLKFTVETFLKYLFKINLFQSISINNELCFVVRCFFC